VLQDEIDEIKTKMAAIRTEIGRSDFSCAGDLAGQHQRQHQRQHQQQETKAPQTGLSRTKREEHPDLSKGHRLTWQLHVVFRCY
jgi:hypothetical protein